MKNNKSKPAAKQIGFIRMMRSNETLELLKHAPNAFRLAAIIAWRARWKEGFNVDGLTQGECFLGDYGKFQMTEKEYRIAKAQLQKWGFAAFKRAGKGRGKGTIAKLIDKRLFDTSPPKSKGRGGGQEGARGAEQGRVSNLGEKRNENEVNEGSFASLPAVESKAIISKPSTDEIQAFAGLHGCGDLVTPFVAQVVNWRGWEDQLREFVERQSDGPIGGDEIPLDRWKPAVAQAL